ncbi:MAG: DNA repair protein RadC [Chloroflexi bacterium]|nr:DNA repair protein RadC [Chloroflexota bacterium]
MAEERPTKPGLEYAPLIRDLPPSERPRERLRAFGPSALGNAELLAIILRTGTASESVLSLASRLLARSGGLRGLARASLGELRSQKGVGEAKAVELQAALELGKRLFALGPEDRPQVRSPQDVANLLLAEMGYLEQEHLRVVLLNTRNQIVAVKEVYRGSVNTSLVRVGEVLREAVRENCPAIVVVHNHPSGDPTPSPEDIEVTKQIVEAGKLLDIEVLDHLIVAHTRFISLREKGLGFK